MSRKAYDHGVRNRHERGYGAAHDRIRAHLLATVILCEECTRAGRTALGEIADHIVPLARGGSGERSNYQLLCRQCAAKKDAAERGVTLKRKRTFGPDGWPIEGD